MLWMVWDVRLVCARERSPIRPNLPSYPPVDGKEGSRGYP